MASVGKEYAMESCARNEFHTLRNGIKHRNNRDFLSAEERN